MVATTVGGPRPVRHQAYEGWVWSAVLAAASACGGQLAVLLVVCALLPAREEAYYAPGPAVGFLVMLPCALLGLVLAGFAHAWTLVLPALALGRAAARRAGDPVLGWALAATVPLAAGYALAARLLTGTPWLPALLWIAGAGVLPVLAAVWTVHRRARGRLATHGRIVGEWTLFTLGGLALVPLALWFGTSTGHLAFYRPPEIGRAEAVGTWRAEDGDTVVRLRADGTAFLFGVPHEGGEFFTTTFCDGTGTWAHDAGDGDRRAGVTVGAPPGCGAAAGRTWLFAGTKEKPELFVVIGDPDAGELYVLRKQEP